MNEMEIAGEMVANGALVREQERPISREGEREREPRERSVVVVGSC